MRFSNLRLSSFGAPFCEGNGQITLSAAQLSWKPKKKSRRFGMAYLLNRALNLMPQGHLLSHHDSMRLQHNRRSPIRIWQAEMGKECKSLQLCTFRPTLCILAVIFPNMCFRAAWGAEICTGETVAAEDVIQRGFACERSQGLGG